MQWFLLPPNDRTVSLIHNGHKDSVPVSNLHLFRNHNSSSPLSFFVWKINQLLGHKHSVSAGHAGQLLVGVELEDGD